MMYYHAAAAQREALSHEIDLWHTTHPETTQARCGTTIDGFEAAVTKRAKRLAPQTLANLQVKLVDYLDTADEERYEAVRAQYIAEAKGFVDAGAARGVRTPYRTRPHAHNDVMTHL